MSDLIDRQDALFALGTITMYKGSIPYDTAVERIKKLKPALSTNLASLGTDCISRQAAIDWVLEGLNNMPSAQPEIIRCRNCKFASGDSRICMKFGHSPIGELDFCAWAERRTDG